MPETEPKPPEGQSVQMPPGDGSAAPPLEPDAPRQQKATRDTKGRFKGSGRGPGRPKGKRGPGRPRKKAEPEPETEPAFEDSAFVPISLFLSGYLGRTLGAEFSFDPEEIVGFSAVVSGLANKYIPTVTERWAEESAAVLFIMGYIGKRYANLFALLSGPARPAPPKEKPTDAKK